jgi:preprotein translocase subunit SecD
MSQPNRPDTRTETIIQWFRVVAIFIVFGLLAFFIYTNTFQENPRYPFKLGLDLAGGSHLVYEADVSDIDPAEVAELMNVLRVVIERRVNVFGVSEPIVYVENSSAVTGEQRHRLVVELPGVTDVEQAVAEIGRTPLLEFKLVNQEGLAQQAALESIQLEGAEESGIEISVPEGESVEPYIDTGLTGRYLASAALEFASGQGGQLSNEPIVSVTFNAEGADLFAQITRDNVGESLAIFLDGELISAPRINEAILGGSAIISGGFTPAEARELAQNLSFGALPMPINLESTQTIGATLGADLLEKGVMAAMIGLGLIALFMAFWYRLPGLIAVIALGSYILIMLTLFKLIPVTLTAAGLAGFVISLGMAVDANVLVFERMKEEFRNGKGSREAAREGFSRAWSAIRDGNITSLLSAIILFWFGTSLVKGFALVFGVGVLISMFSAIVITRTLLIALPDRTKEQSGLLAKLYDSSF